MKDKGRSALGDVYDRTIRALDGLPDVVKTKATTITGKSKVLERTQTFIVQTYRQKDEGNTIFVQYIDCDGCIRIALPADVAATIARQYEIVSKKMRKKSAQNTVQASIVEAASARRAV